MVTLVWMAVKFPQTAKIWAKAEEKIFASSKMKSAASGCATAAIIAWMVVSSITQVDKLKYTANTNSLRIYGPIYTT